MNFKKLYIPMGFIVGIAVGVFAANQFPYYAQKWEGTGNRYKTTEFYIGTPSAGAAAIFAPGTTNVNDLGSSALRFRNMYGVGLDISGNTTLGDAATDVITFTGLTQLQVSATPRSSITPTAAGQLIFNSTGKELCMSTGTSIASWVRVSSGVVTTACSN